MKMRIFTIGLLGLFSIVFFAGCTTTKKYRALESDNTRMAEENVMMKQQLEEAEMENEQKDLRIVSLESELEQYKAAAEMEAAKLKDTYDSLVKALEAEIAKGQIEVQNVKGKFNLTIAEQLFFETGKADIKPSGEAILYRIAKVMKTIPEKNIRVEGHTDSVPIVSALRKLYPTNWELGSARATNVVRFLQDKGGIDPLRLSAVSYGQYRPVASNKTERGRSMNRRIEIILIDRDLDLAKKMRQNL
jgi:chemotaxis protein MotB